MLTNRARGRRPVRRQWYRRRSAKIALLAVVGVVAALGLLAAIRLAKVSSDLQRARTLLVSAGAQIEQGQLAVGRQQLTEAQVLLTNANGRLYSDPSLQVLDLLPVFHQNLGALRDSVGLALRMADGGNRILAITQPLESATGRIEVPLDAGTIPLQAVQQLQKVTDELASSLPGSGAQPSTRFVIGPVADAQEKLYREAGVRQAQLDAVAHGLRLLSALSGERGPKRYLIAVANSAEMRGTGGMILSYGVLEANAGTFKLGEFGNIDELFLDTPIDPASLNLPEDFLARWGNLEPTRLWRNTTVNPDFTLSAPILEAMFTAKTGLPADGVIQVDPAGLGAILAGTGPVEVGDLGPVGTENVVDLTLNRAYVDFPDRDQRQELLGDVARAAFERLVGGKLDSLRPLGEAVYDAALARHIVFWANDPAMERESLFFGAAGALPSPDVQDYALLSVENFSKNKLDYYVDTSLSVTGDRPSKKSGTLTATITITNTAPPDGSASYVFGTNAGPDLAGLYRGVVSLYVPNGVSLVSADGGPTTAPPALTADAGRSVVAFEVELQPGQSSTVTLQLAFVPRSPGPYSISFVPIGRVRPTIVSADITADDSRVTLTPSPLIAPTVLRARAS